MKAAGATLSVSELLNAVGTTGLSVYDDVRAVADVGDRWDSVNIVRAEPEGGMLLLELDELPLLETECEREHLDGAYEPGDLPNLPEAVTDAMRRRPKSFTKWPKGRETAWVLVLERPAESAADSETVGMIALARPEGLDDEIHFEWAGSITNRATRWVVIA